MKRSHGQASEATLADRYAELWKQPDRQPDLQAFVDQHEGLSARELADILLVDQAFRWQRRCEIAVEEYLQKWPMLVTDPEARLDLVYGELQALLDRGERPDAASFARRFPDLAERLARQMKADAAVRQMAESSAEFSTLDESGQGTVVTPHPSRDTPVDPQAPLLFSDFELEDRLGGGGMGDVYRATQKSLDKQVAVKILKFGALAHHGMVQRFLREGRAAAAVKHPNIVDVHGIGRCDDGGYFLVMDLVEGISLDRWLADKPMAFAEAARIVQEAATAIAHANQQGVIHRDLKPSNVLLDGEGRVRVTDFGLAKLRDVHWAEMSAPGQIIGTPQYMAPEQVDSHRWGEVGPRTDVYGLGGLLYVLLVGKPPFQGNSVTDLLHQIVSDQTSPSPRSVRPEIPPALEAVCLKCLTKNPAGRYSSAREVADALRDWARQTAPHVPAAGPEPAPARQSAPIAKLLSPWWMLIAAAVATVLLTSMVVKFWPTSTAEQSLEVAWNIDVYRDGQPEPHVRLPHEPAPLHTGDRLRIRLELTRAVYAHVLWIDSEGQVRHLFPDNPRDQQRVKQIHVPAAADSVLPVIGSSGTEVCVVVLRESPLDASLDLAAALAPPGAFPPLESNTILLEGRALPSPSGPGEVQEMRTTFPSPKAWLEGERPRGVGPAEPLYGPAVLDYLDLWHQSLPAEIGQVRYLALPHQD